MSISELEVLEFLERVERENVEGECDGGKMRHFGNIRTQLLYFRVYFIGLLF